MFLSSSQDPAKPRRLQEQPVGCLRRRQERVRAQTDQHPRGWKRLVRGKADVFKNGRLDSFSLH